MSFEPTKTKLKTIASESNKTFMEVFKQLSFERFLARVGRSEYRENLIFKGGLCLKQYIDTERETKDIDFLIREIDGKIETVTEVFKGISAINLEDHYDFKNVNCSLLEVGHKQYPGFRIKIDIFFGNMTDRLQVDIGLGDVVDVHKLNFQTMKYKNDSLLNSGDLSLLAYPAEFIFSEKLQAIIELKSFNSRVKDYFDCYMLVTQNKLDDKKVKNAVTKTFQHRKTQIQLIDDFSNELNPKWKPLLKKINFESVELSFVIQELNSYLKRIL